MYFKKLLKEIYFFLQEDFAKVETDLNTYREILYKNIREEEDNCKYVILLLVLEIELRMEIDEIKKEQNKLFNKYSKFWTNEQLCLWKINYAAFIYEEEREYDEALNILTSIQCTSKEYYELYNIMGQIYFSKEDYVRAEQCFIKLIKLYNRKDYKYKAYILAYSCCLFMNGKYEDMLPVLEPHIEQVNWCEETDIIIVSNLLMTYHILEFDEKKEKLLSRLNKYKDNIIKVRDEDFFDEVCAFSYEPEYIYMCPYIYCPRHNS